MGGNWKSNGTFKMVTDLVKELNAGAVTLEPREVEVVVAPPFVSRVASWQALMGTRRSGAGQEIQAAVRSELGG